MLEHSSSSVLGAQSLWLLELWTQYTTVHPSMTSECITFFTTEAHRDVFEMHSKHGKRHCDRKQWSCLMKHTIRWFKSFTSYCASRQPVEECGTLDSKPWLTKVMKKTDEAHILLYNYSAPWNLPPSQICNKLGNWFQSFPREWWCTILQSQLVTFFIIVGVFLCSVNLYIHCSITHKFTKFTLHT